MHDEQTPPKSEDDAVNAAALAEAMQPVRANLPEAVAAPATFDLATWDVTTWDD